MDSLTRVTLALEYRHERLAVGPFCYWPRATVVPEKGYNLNHRSRGVKKPPHARAPRGTRPSYAACRAQGICVKCRRSRASDDTTMCFPCRGRNARQSNDSHARRRQRVRMFA